MGMYIHTREILYEILKESVDLELNILTWLMLWFGFFLTRDFVRQETLEDDPSSGL